MHVCMLATAIIRDGTIYWYITVSWHTKSDTVSIQIQVTPIYQISWHIDVSVSIDSILHTLYTLFIGWCCSKLIDTCKSCIVLFFKLLSTVFNAKNKNPILLNHEIFLHQSLHIVHMSTAFFYMHNNWTIVIWVVSIEIQCLLSR